jgi:uncharacterized protein
VSRLERLESLFQEMGSCLLAYSGGIDSTFLLAVARKVLEERCLAVTVHALFHEEEEIEDARRRAAALGARHEVMELDISRQEAALINPPDRCYHCKKAIFTSLLSKAREEGAAAVVEASHADDRGERRPGMKALEELGVRSPLLETGFTKEEIRASSLKLGIEGADRFSRPCLATRIPYGTPVTVERLRRVAAAEKALAGLGFTSCRVRDYDVTARIELRAGGLERLGDGELRGLIVAALRDIGYTYVTVDLAGYRSGSMDEVL